MKLKTYAEAVYHVKRGFLIIGVTGYTGAGCSTASRILSQSANLTMPGFEIVVSNQHDKMSKRIYDKLKRSWQKLDWQPFTVIEVARIIFALAVYKAISSSKDDKLLNEIRVIVGENSTKLKALEYLLIPKPFHMDKDKGSSLVDAYNICLDLYRPFKKKISGTLAEFIELMQNLGDEIRRYGEVSPDLEMKPSPENLFILPEAIRRLMKAYDETNGEKQFIIDAFRNPYEVEYFKRRYSEFYLVGVMRDLKEREAELLRVLPVDFIQKLEDREQGKTIKRKKNNIADWVASQNIDECLQKVDYFVENVFDTTKTFPHLKFNLMKLITLAKHPGCIPPSEDERCMQFAMTARQMSRCISRQVGAVIFNRQGYIIGIGWNDPPRGQVPCSLRTGKELIENPNAKVFSDFERSEEFVKYIKENYNEEHPFCSRSFIPIVLKKDDDKMMEYTRALHAEENALFQAAWQTGDKLHGATLYTTASTCTLCAKKAYQLGIQKMVYIEEYPGIAVSQTIKAGNREIQISRFVGATGSAYFRLFSSLMPEKDLVQLYM